MFNSPDGPLDSIFVNDYAMIDQYAKTGSLWMWGGGTVGELGDNTIVSKSSPVQTIAGGTNWKYVSSNGGAIRAGIKTDGTLWLWGNNQFGALGDGTTAAKSSPVQISGGGTNWRTISAGPTWCAAIKTDGTLWTWGYNYQGMLGDNTLTPKSTPVQTVAGGNNWKQVSATGTRGASGGYFGAAIKTNGTLWMWGSNNQFNFGDGTSTSTSSPVQIGVSTNWKQVDAGGRFSAGIKTDGTLWTWGYNGYGGIGDNSSASDWRSTPVQTIAGGTNWKILSCAGTTTIGAIKNDGTLWIWGSGGNGKLGDNTNNAKSSPVQTITGGTNWKQIWCTSSETKAIKTDGTLWAWGRGSTGELGDSTNADKSSPVQTYAGGNNWKQVSGNAAIHFYDAGNLYPNSAGGAYSVARYVYATAGTYTFTVPTGMTTLDLLVVGGGGSGGYITTQANIAVRGGGGAGQVVRNTTYAVTAGETLTIVIGAGGTSTTTSGSSGASSTITRSSTGITTTAIGGNAAGTSINGGTSGNAFSGGVGASGSGGGGGGGSTAVGQTSTLSNGGSGGAGTSTTIGGVTASFGGGGGGGANSLGGAGGSNVGGIGAFNDGPGGLAVAGTGSGGGGAAKIADCTGYPFKGGNGSNGTVIFYG